MAVADDLERLLGGQSAEVIAELHAKLEAQADDAATWLRLGIAYFGIEHLSEAAGALERALALDGDLGEARLWLGRALGRLGRHEQSLAELERAAALTPDDARVHKELGLVLYDLSRHDEAARSLARATRLAPGDARAHYALGLVHEARRDMGAAIASYRQAVKRDERFAEARKTLADALAQMGELSLAIEELRAVLRLERANERVAQNLALLERALAALRATRLLGNTLDAVERSALVVAGKLERGAGGSPHEAGRALVRYRAKLAEVWVELGADERVARLSLVLPDPEKAARRRDEALGVVVVSHDGRRLPADFATAASLTFLREALGCTLTRAGELYGELLAVKSDLAWGGARVGFARFDAPESPGATWNGLYAVPEDEA